MEEWKVYLIAGLSGALGAGFGVWFVNILNLGGLAPFAGFLGGIGVALLAKLLLMVFGKYIRI